MRILKEDDSIFEILFKIVTIGSLAFGIWAYFHSVKPVFDKEKEFLNSRYENRRLREENEGYIKNLSKLELQISEQQQVVQELGIERSALEQDILKSKKKLNDLRDALVKYKDMLKEKEDFINSLLSEENDAGWTAIEANVKRFRDRMFSEYIAAIQSGQKEKFDLQSVASDIIRQEGYVSGNSYHAKALDLFKKYYEKHLNEKVPESKAHSIIFQLDQEFNSMKYQEAIKELNRIISNTN